MNPPITVLVSVFVTFLVVTTPFVRKGYSETMPGYKNPNLPVELRVADLLGRMTLEEKAAQTWCIWQKNGDAQDCREMREWNAD